MTGQKCRLGLVPMGLVLVIFFCGPAGCKARHGKIDSSRAEEAGESDDGGENALKEYVNVPKQKAKDVKDRLETAQDKVHDQSKQLVDDE